MPNRPRQPPTPSTLCHWPAQTILITDEASARRFASLLDPPCRLAAPKDLSLTAVCSVYTNHRTHWIAVARFEGHKDPAENGHAVYCLPKLLFSHEEVRAQLRQNLGKTVNVTFVDPSSFSEN